MTEWRFETNQIDCEEKCTKIPTHTIKITKNAENKIKQLIKQVSETEWMAILTGTTNEETTKIEDLIIPEQEVTTTHVELTTKGDQEASQIKRIGWIHSHNTMSAFFSKEDMNTASQNEISIVVNNKLEMKALKKVKLPCGQLKLTEPSIETEIEEDKTLIQKIKDKIIEVKIVKTKTSYDWPKDWPKAKETIKYGNTCAYCKQQIKKGKEETCYGQKYHKHCLEELDELIQISDVKDKYQEYPKRGRREIEEDEYYTYYH